MQKFNVEDFTKGWIIGNFEPSLHKTEEFEVAIKQYSTGDKEDRHVHRIATEYTIVVNGTIRMNGIILHRGEGIQISPGESTDFEAIESSTTVVIKVPGVAKDKYEAN